MSVNKQKLADDVLKELAKMKGFEEVQKIDIGFYVKLQELLKGYFHCDTTNSAKYIAELIVQQEPNFETFYQDLFLKEYVYKYVLEIANYRKGLNLKAKVFLDLIMEQNYSVLVQLNTKLIKYFSKMKNKIFDKQDIDKCLLKKLIYNKLVSLADDNIKQLDLGNITFLYVAEKVSLNKEALQHLIDLAEEKKGVECNYLISKIDYETNEICFELL